MDPYHRGIDAHDWRDLRWLVELSTSHEPCSIELSNGKVAHANLAGQVMLGPNLTLKNVIFVPGVICNLILIGKLARDLK